MRLKTKLVLAITALVFSIAGMLSLVYVSQLLHEAVQQSYDTNRMIAKQVRLALENALKAGLKDRTVDPGNPAELRALEAEAVRGDAALQAVVDSVNLYSLTVYDINIGDSQSSTLLSTNPENEDKPLPVRPDYRQLLDAGPIELMREVFGPPRVFDLVVPLDRNGAPFATVHIGVRTTLLRAVYAPWLTEALTLMGFALLTALVVAFLLGNLALRPLEKIDLQLDYWTGSAGADSQEANEEHPEARRDTAARVSSKIEIIGQRMRNVEEVFSALKENLDQVLLKLQDGILLFTGDGRAVLVSEAARRFFAIESGAILGLHAREIFNPSTVLGQTLREAFDSGAALDQEEILTETGRRVRVSLDFIRDPRAGEGPDRQLGALVTLHDLESVEEIESELELSRRLSSIGRLTSGVGHEVKNPINAIVVHLELLKTKLGDAGAPPPGSDRRGDSSPGPRGADAGRLYETGGARTARTGSAPGSRRCAGAGCRGAFYAQCHPGQPPSIPAAHGQHRCGPAEAGGAECDRERRSGHAGRRPAGGNAGGRTQSCPPAHCR
jgi:PAS domain-containing protein